jgi:hypothetical protein
MKKTIVLVIAIVLVISMLPSVAFAGQVIRFKDVKDADWFKPYVDAMSEKGICEGYGNGMYGPQDNLQVDQLLKMVVVAMGFNPEFCDTDIYWACRYIKQAKELGLIEDGEYSDYTRKITRGEIARIIVRGMTETFPENLDDYKSLIKDYAGIEADMQQYVLKVYCKGIVGGYPDGRYAAGDYATRAEASKMIVCFIDPDKRVLPALPKTESTEVINGYTIPFNSTTVFDDDSPNTDMSIYLTLTKSLAPQYDEVKAVLSSKFGSETANQIIEYIKTKTDPDFDLKQKVFKSSSYYIDVSGYGWTISILVYSK